MKANRQLIVKRDSLKRAQLARQAVITDLRLEASNISHCLSKRAKRLQYSFIVTL